MFNNSMDVNFTNSNDVIEGNEPFSSLAKANLVFTMFGMIGNTICICVFIQKNLLIRKFNWYLLILAIAEFFFCAIVFANTIVFAISPEEGKMLHDLSLIPCFFFEYSVNSIDAFCVFLTLLLSIDRLKAILDPINSRLFFTNRYPKRITLTSLIIILILKSPEIILAQRRFIDDPLQIDDNSTKCNISDYPDLRSQLPKCPDCYDKNKEAYIIICGITLPLLLNIIPTILILILNTILLIYITNYKNKAMTLLTNQTKTVKQLTNIQQKSHHFTIIIMGVWLLITSAPYYTINTIIRISHLNIFQKSNSFHLEESNIYLYQALASLFFNSNHCINILIYVVFHKSFRYNLLRILARLFICKSINKQKAYYNTNISHTNLDTRKNRLSRKKTNNSNSIKNNNKNNNLRISSINNNSDRKLSNITDASNENSHFPIDEPLCDEIDINNTNDNKKRDSSIFSNHFFCNLLMKQVKNSNRLKQTNGIVVNNNKHEIELSKMPQISDKYIDSDDDANEKDILIFDNNNSNNNNNYDLLVIDNISIINSSLILSSKQFDADNKWNNQKDE